MSDDQRARLAQAKLAALVRDLRGADAPAGALGSGACAVAGAEAFVLQEQAGPGPLAAGLLYAMRSGAERLVLFADHGAPASARLAGWFALPVEVRVVQGASSRPAEPEPLPVVLPAPDGAEELLQVLTTHHLEVVLEDGSWRGELLGLEVARLVVWPEETGGDGALHLEAGVGRFDRDAVAVMHSGEAPVEALERAVRIVAERRHRGAGPHPLNLLARARWLRADALAQPALVGAAHLEPVQTSFPADNVRDPAPAAAVGTTTDGAPVVVVFAAGAALDLTPVAADTRALHDPDATLRLAIPPRDHLAALDQLAGLLLPPLDVVEIEPGWA